MRTLSPFISLWILPNYSKNVVCIRFLMVLLSKSFLLSEQVIGSARVSLDLRTVQLGALQMQVFIWLIRTFSTPPYLWIRILHCCLLPVPLCTPIWIWNIYLISRNYYLACVLHDYRLRRYRSNLIISALLLLPTIYIEQVKVESDFKNGWLKSCFYQNGWACWGTYWVY